MENERKIIPLNKSWFFHLDENLPDEIKFFGNVQIIEFDGVYRNCVVFMNGHFVGQHLSGYTSFGFQESGQKPYVASTRDLHPFEKAEG